MTRTREGFLACFSHAITGGSQLGATVAPVSQVADASCELRVSMSVTTGPRTFVFSMRI